MLIAVAGVSFVSDAKASTPAVETVNLGGAEGFAVLAGAAFTEGARNVISGSTIFNVAGASSGYGLAASTAFADAQGRAANFTSGALDFGVNRTITSGVYKITSDVSATGTLTLDFQNDPNSVFIIQVRGYLSTEAGFAVVLTNGANAANVFWQIDSYFTPGASTNFKGTVLAGTYITTGASLNLEGRLFAMSGAITTGDDNIVNKPSSVTTTTTTTVPSTTTSTTTSTTVPSTTTTVPSTTTSTTVPSTTTTVPSTTTTVPSTTTTVPSTTVPSTTTAVRPTTTNVPPSKTVEIFSLSLSPFTDVAGGGNVIRKMRLPQISVPKVKSGWQAAQDVTVVIRPTSQYKKLIWRMSLKISSSRPTKTDIYENHLTICVTATTPQRKSVLSLNSPFHIRIPKILSDRGIFAYSRNDGIPSEISQLRLQRLPANMSKGYFIQADGAVRLYSRVSGCFNIRQPLK